MMSQDPHNEQELTDSVPDGASEEEQVSQNQEPASAGRSLTRTQWVIFAVVLTLVVVGIGVAAYRTTAGWLATQNTITTTPSPENAVPAITTPVAEVPDEISPVEERTAVTAPEISTMEAETPSVALSDCAAAPPPETMVIYDGDDTGTPTEWCYLIGQAALTQGKYEDALRDLHRSDELEPNNVYTQQTLASAYAAIGDNEKAIKLYKASLDSKSEAILEERAYRELGGLYTLQGQYNEARDAFEKLRSLNPEDSSVEIGIGNIAYVQGQYAIAREAYDRAIKMHPNSPYHYISRGDASHALGEMDQALRDYAKAIEVSPGGEVTIMASLRRGGSHARVVILRLARWIAL